MLYTFTGRADGGDPYSPVVFDAAGNLYGTTFLGGGRNYGVVYKLDAAGTYTVLHSFEGGSDGAGPYAGVTLDAAGNLYGTTFGGGTANVGTVYEVDTAGNETVLYSFTGTTDGGFPYAGVILDSSGNLYGTTQDGGTANKGVVYKLDANGQETVLSSFASYAHGHDPWGGVIRDDSGDFYGTTKIGGLGKNGVVYKLSSNGQEIVLYNFTGRVDGGYPLSGVIRDPAGNLYGACYDGGANSSGLVYMITP